MAKRKGKEILLNTNITPEQFDELKEVKRNIFAFAKGIFVIHPKKGRVRFDLYPFQIKVLWEFIQNRFNIVLKFRQAGITELIAMFCLWFAMYHPFKNVQIISIKERTAKRVLRRIKYMYENIPDHWKVPVVNGRGDDIGTSTELEFANGSMIVSIPTTEEAGRSEAASLLVIDEAAIIRWASQIWAAAYPTLSTGGRAILNSTPYGMGNWFHKMWVEALQGLNGFKPIRLYWWMHPERDKTWYQEQLAALGPRRTAQEIDGDFLTSGHSVFDLVEIRALEDEVKDLTYAEISMNGCLYIYEWAQPGSKYSIGADVSTGRGRDYSAFTIMDEDGNESGCFKGKVAPTRLATLMGDLGVKFNRALLAPESNDIGLSCTEKLQDMGYPNLYFSKKVLREKGKRRLEEDIIPGWYTNSKTRPLMIAGLEEDIRQRNLRVVDPFFIQEAYTFIYDAANRPIAMNKDAKSKEGNELLSDEAFSDDAIMGKSITNRVRKIKKYGPVIAPQG